MARGVLNREIRLPASRDRWALVSLTALAVFFFRRAVFGGQVLFLRDISMVWYPRIASFVRIIASGSWPLWDPYRGFGQPLLADPSSQVLYPPTWLNLLVPPHVYCAGFVVLHITGSAWGVYALARHWRASRGGAFVAAAVWVASGPFLSLASVWHHLAGAAYIPWVFLAAERALETETTRAALVWGTVLGVQILAGSADMVVLGGLALTLYLLLQHVAWGIPSGPRNRRIARAGALAVVLALGLSTAQWMPTLETTLRSARWSLFSPRDRTMWSLHPLGLLEVVFPFAWSSLPPISEDMRDVFDLHVTFLHSLYLGIPSLALVAAGAAFWHSRRRCLLLIGAAGILLSLGRHTAIYDVAVLMVPPLRILRYPVKAMLLVALCWSLLAGMGFDVWRDPLNRGRRWLFGVVSPLAVLTALCLGGAALCLRWAEGWGAYVVPRAPQHASYADLLFPIGINLIRGLCFAAAALFCSVVALRRVVPGYVVATGIAAVALLDLLVAHGSLHPVAPKELIAARPETLDALERRDVAPRVYVCDYTDEARRRGEGLPSKPFVGYALARAPVGWSSQAATALGLRLYLHPPTAGQWGLYGSYDQDLLGLYPPSLADLTEHLRAVEGTPLHLRLLRLGSVDYALALLPERWWADLVRVATVPGLFVWPIRVFRVPNPLPRSYVVGGARIADGSPAIQSLSDPGFDPAIEVILPDGEPRQAGSGFSATSAILELKPDRVRIAVEANQPGYAVLVDSYDPGWRATVDGQPAPVLRANVAFRAVPITAGSHVIEHVYRPRTVAWGLLLSFFALLLGAAAAMRRGPVEGGRS